MALSPQGWTDEEPSNPMRLRQWRAPGEVECALFHFAGGGDVEANVERWLGQFEAPDGSPSVSGAQRMTIEVSGVVAHLVRVTGTYITRDPPMSGEITRHPEYGLFGVVFDVSPDPYFLKCVGPALSMESQAAQVSELVDSFRFSE